MDNFLEKRKEKALQEKGTREDKDLRLDGVQYGMGDHKRPVDPLVGYG